MNMAIQTQWYTNNSASPFCNNDVWAGGLCDSHVNFDQKHYQQQHLRELHNGSQGTIQPNLHVCNSKAVNCPMFATQVEWEEIDQYIKSQNEELRHMLQEYGKQQVRALLKKLESFSLHILRKKDEEIAQAAKKKLELEAYLRRLEAENMKWQKMAQENETMALSLYKTLERMTEGGYFLNNGVVASDALSFCDETGGKEEMQEEATRKKRVECCGEFEEIRMLCKSCHSRRSCFLFLPCRHLSCCKVCNSFIEACPVCRTPKKATIELRL
ncbi:hypothetical protein Fmac_022480 [Flemingia macrophylla]|uniref:RING-type domain-containing protein n=1 Tax=Flemingia macrophylla TaxID=520843 RepID=A0ABD1LZU1_9FABA